MDYISQINSAENNFVYVIILVLPVFPGDLARTALTVDSESNPEVPRRFPDFPRSSQTFLGVTGPPQRSVHLSGKPVTSDVSQRI